MERSNRNTAMFFIGAGLYLAIGAVAGYLTASALLLAALGFALLRSSGNSEQGKRSAYVVFAIAGFVLIANHWLFMLGLAAAGIGWYFIKTKGETRQGVKFVKQSIVESVRWEKDEPWVLESTDITVAVAEVRIDLTKALLEQKDTQVNLQGVIGDIDVIVPEDIGLSVNASVLLGQIQVAGEKGAGAMNRLVWRSPNFESAEHRILLNISYAVADVDVKVL
ncbi:cell wall-active antibiotics response protein LiaF [Paenibacillus alkalitolerans]|uniref:cell wall-active antibiotics response protein LiaF n=1 Tax=Paenibacillus alkalitolerans TaxID=2799335 RepID=UPI0018F7B8D5|nr:cell wall-active antibiotics response protein LiaF [Paenibacillus alkalitolerans]